MSIFYFCKISAPVYERHGGPTISIPQPTEPLSLCENGSLTGIEHHRDTPSSLPMSQKDHLPHGKGISFSGGWAGGST